MQFAERNQVPSAVGQSSLPVLSLAPADSRQAMEHISSQLLRALRHDCGMLISTDDLDAKVALGCRIGYVGRAIEQLRQRSFELDANHPSGFDEELGMPLGEGHRAALERFEPQDLLATFQGRMVPAIGIADVAQRIPSLVGNLDPVKDEPTVLVLQGVEALLKRATEREVPTSAEVSPREEGSSIPGRPSFLRRGTKADIANVSFEETARNDDHLARLMHFIYVDVEIPVMEICSRNILDFPEMPVQFQLDMARQIWDEARHAQFMRDGFEQKGVKLGDYAYSGNAWKIVVENESLVDRLVIEQIILEGNGLDAGVLIAGICRERGDVSTALCFEYQNVDELTHCRIGHRWLQRLLGHNEPEYRALIDRCCEKINQKVPGSAPVAFKARIAAGFPERFVVSLMGTQET